MGGLRASLRIPALAVVTLVLFLGWLATRPCGWFSTRAGARSQRFFVGLWARCLVRVLGIHVHLRGEPPRAPFFFASNHLSYVDIVVLLAHLDASFLAKKEVAGWPVLGFLARAVGTLFIDRTKKSDLLRANALVQERLDRGQGVIVFPEGTSTDGSQVRPFRASVFEVPLRAGLPVHYGSLSYETPAGSPPANLCVCWWGEMTFVDHLLSLLTLPRIEAWLVFGDEPIEAQDRKSLASRTERAIVRQFRPVVGSLPTHGHPVESHP